VVLCEFFPLYEFPPDSCALVNDEKKSKEINDNQSITNNGSNAGSTIPYAYQNRDHPSTLEWLLAGWTFTLLCEEFRQVILIFFFTFLYILILP
jgi:hypothetical protein